MSRRVEISGLLVLALAAVGCGTDSQALPIRNLDRPSDMAFACFGDLRADGAVIVSAQPVSSCVAHASGAAPEGQEDIISPVMHGFILQPSRGTVSILNVPALGVQDNDPLTPGLNDIPVGTLPVAIEGDQSGCFVLTANAGSCDMASIDITSALDLKRTTVVNRVPFRAPDDGVILAKPRALAMGPQTEIVGDLCPAAPVGVLYVAYPECRLVAAVDAATGKAVGGLAFREDGTVELAVEEDYDCPVECTDSIVAARGIGDEERPVAMKVSPDGKALYIASETSRFLTVAELDDAGVPTGVPERFGVEGNVGITAFAVSDRIDMGGDERDGTINSPVGEFQFAYAIATDSTIRVLDLDAGHECDTQVDPRYLGDETDVAFLSCMPVGDVRTAPRRFGAKGPGIQLPGRILQGRNGLASVALPLDVVFSTSPPSETATAVSDPNTMVGTFAFITAANGRVFVVNVDDDNYADTEVDEDPIAVSMPLAIAHQLRDAVPDRNRLATGCSTPLAEVTQIGARLMSPPSQIVDPNQVSVSKLHELPFLQGLSCDGEDALGNPEQSILTELAFPVDVEVRETAFPDLRHVENQRWSLRWEGAMSSDSLNVNIDGPTVRKAVMKTADGRSYLQDAAEAFCAQGVQPFDIASMLGCDPARDDAQCGVGEKCYVHPEAPAVIQTGFCLPEARVDELSATCREFLIGRRQYSVLSSSKSELELIERRRVLRSSPLDGCESAVQCDELAVVERLTATNLHPLELDLLPDAEREYNWVCEADPSRADSGDRCVMSCDTSAACEAGFSCSAGRCVEGVLPPSACLGAVQRYQMRVGGAFSLLAEDDGFQHSVVAKAGTGTCVQSATSHPLAIGRIPLRPAPCDDDDDPLTGPNPCQTTVSHTEEHVPYLVEDGVCVAQAEAFRTRETSAIRISTPALSFHLADSETTGDLECVNDQLGDNPTFGTPYTGYQILFDIGGGFLPMLVPNLEAALPIRIINGPSGNLWVMDQGDASSITRGRIYRLNPTAPGGFELVTIL